MFLYVRSKDVIFVFNIFLDVFNKGFVDVLCLIMILLLFNNLNLNFLGYVMNLKIFCLCFLLIFDLCFFDNNVDIILVCIYVVL